MGVLRKTSSVFSLGLVDFKSDKERIATSTRKTKVAVRKQNRLLSEQNRILRQPQASRPALTPQQRERLRDEALGHWGRLFKKRGD